MCFQSICDACDDGVCALSVVNHDISDFLDFALIFSLYPLNDAKVLLSFVLLVHVNLLLHVGSVHGYMISKNSLKVKKVY